MQLSNRAGVDCLLAHGATDMLPVTHGNAISVYCRDPEGNVFQLREDD